MTDLNEKGISQNLQIVEVERKEGKMAEKIAEQSPNQRDIPETSQENKQLNKEELLSTTTGTATSSPENRN